MTRFFVILCACTLLPTLGFSQFSAHVDASYGLPLGAQQIGTIVERNPNVFGYRFDSYGAGIQAGARLGYHWNMLQGAEIGIRYQGSTIQNNSFTDTTGVQTGTNQSQQIQLTPTLLFGRIDEGLRPFARIGLIIPIRTRFSENFEFDNTFNIPGQPSVTTELSQTRDYQLTRSLGAVASLGIRYRTGSISITVEAYAQTLNLRPVRNQLVRYVLNGEDLLAQQDLPTILVEQEYFEVIDENNNGFGPNSDPDQPGSQLMFVLPYSTYGLRVGIGTMLGN
ncbi:MAG: hypothetical protein AAF804_11585 [Bacteroidota bacterium]